VRAAAGARRRAGSAAPRNRKESTLSRIIIEMDQGILNVEGLPAGMEVEIRDYGVPDDYEGPDVVVAEDARYQRVLLVHNGAQGET
jgi:hypothetical protein